MTPHDSLSRSNPILTARSSLFISLLACACGPMANPGTTDDTPQSSTTTGSNASTSTTDPVGVTVTSGSSSSTTLEPTSSEPAPTTDDPNCNFICRTDMLSCAVGLGARCSLCDVFAQDCADGEKCAAVITGGSAWDSTRCVPVTGDGVNGEPCTAESVADGLDSCAEGNMCWGVDMDGNGTCVELCMGTPDAPTCPDMGQCTIANDGVLNLCLPDCDPLLQDCGPNEACYPFDDGFTCAPTSPDSVGKTNDPCTFITECASGFLCGEAALVGAGCPEGSEGCCTPFCEFPDGPCPNPDQQCVQWFDPMMLPPDDPKLHIGSCGLPP